MFNTQMMSTTNLIVEFIWYKHFISHRYVVTIQISMMFNLANEINTHLEFDNGSANMLNVMKLMLALYIN